MGFVMEFHQPQVGFDAWIMGFCYGKIICNQEDATEKLNGWFCWSIIAADIQCLCYCCASSVFCSFVVFAFTCAFCFSFLPCFFGFAAFLSYQFVRLSSCWPPIIRPTKCKLDCRYFFLPAAIVRLKFLDPFIASCRLSSHDSRPGVLWDKWWVLRVACFGNREVFWAQISGIVLEVYEYELQSGVKVVAKMSKAGGTWAFCAWMQSCWRMSLWPVGLVADHGVWGFLGLLGVCTALTCFWMTFGQNSQINFSHKGITPGQRMLHMWFCPPGVSEK